MSPAPAARRRPALTTLASAAAVTTAALLLAGCSDDDDAAKARVEVAPLTDDLCSRLSNGLLGRWALTDLTHDTTPAPDADTDDQRRATCRARGTFLGRPITLSLSATAYGAASRQAVGDRMDDEVAAACADLKQRAAASGASFTAEPDGTSCQSESLGASASDVSRNPTINGVSTVDVAYDVPAGATEALEDVQGVVLGLSGLLALDHELTYPD